MPYFLARLTTAVRHAANLQFENAKMLAGSTVPFLIQEQATTMQPSGEKWARHLGGLFIENFEKLLNRIWQDLGPLGLNFADHIKLL